ncbi:MAG: hypothetical protein JXB05_13365 [Myxococcaceae bacterium]|nr:hypothetical protein [Myxococcaceae bacterium]
MNDLTRASLVGIARHFYPAGFPVEEEDLSAPTPAHQRTPEHERFMAAWEKALAWPEWKTLMKELPRAFPGLGVGGGTQPFVSACMRCFVYRAEPMPGGERFATRIAAAVSVLAPLYVVYVTTQLWRPTYTTYGKPRGIHPSGDATDDESSRLYHFSPPQLTFEPPSAVKPEADTLARLLEEVLGYRRFPLALAGEPLPDLRVGFLNGEGPPTLLDALFSDNLAHLP